MSEKLIEAAWEYGGQIVVKFTDGSQTGVAGELVSFTPTTILHKPWRDDQVKILTLKCGYLQETGGYRENS